MSTRFGDHGRPGPVDAAPRTITAADLRAWIARSEQAVVRHRAYLDRLDASLGDGDHGENMSVGLGEAVRALGGELDATDPGEVLRRLGQLLVASVGGAGGSLYGTAFMEAGIAVAGQRELDAPALAAAFDAAAEGVARRGRCRAGDKTIYDAMRPAADAVARVAGPGGDVEAAIGHAAAAAWAGMRATRPLIARRGLALRLGERSRGHVDPGAVSCFLLVRAMLAGHRA
jgi:dihydroxyacetone kinase-like protein